MRRRHGSRTVRILGRIVILFMLWQALSVQNDPLSGQAHSEVAITPRRGGDPPLIEVRLARAEADSTALLVTAMNLGSRSTSTTLPRVRVNQLTKLTSNLVGWFAIESPTARRELWIGVRLKDNEYQGNITLSAPTTIHNVPGRPNRYQIEFSSPGSVVESLKRESRGVIYAPVTQVRFNQPNWAAVTKTSKWLRGPNRTYYVAEPLKTTAAVIEFEEIHGLFARWVEQKMSTFLTGMLVALSLLVAVLGQRAGKYGQISMRVRIVIFVFGVLGLLLVFALGGGWPPDVTTLVFEGAFVIGFTLPFLIAPWWKDSLYVEMANVGARIVSP